MEKEPLVLTEDVIRERRERRRKAMNIIINHFNSGNRSVSGDSSECYYRSEDGSKCAVGIFIKDEYIDDDDWIETHNQTDIKCLIDDTDEILVEEYRGLGPWFWEDMQWLHDEKDNWTDGGLSPAGEEAVAKIKELNKL